MSFVFEKLFVEPYRETRRKAMKRTRLEDIFWYSGIYDYKYLRMIYNLPIGFGLCYAVYNLGWKRLNFADFDENYEQIFQWSVIAFCMLGFSISPVFRCALICVCLGAVGGSGQGLLSVFVVEKLSDGPINNTVSNFRATADLIVCNLEIQRSVMDYRIGMVSGTFQKLLEQKFQTSLKKSKELVELLRASIDPFTEQFEMDSKEERRLEALIENNQRIYKRYQLAERLQETADPEEIPFWTRFKSKVARGMARRLEQRCSEITVSAHKKCYNTFTSLKNRCDRSLSFFIKLIFRNFCADMDPLKTCKIEEMTKKIRDQCIRPAITGNNSIFTNSFDHDMNSIGDVSSQVRNQLKLNLHYHAVQEPRFVHFRLLADVKAKLQNQVVILQVILKTCKEFLSTMLIFFVYSIFRDCVAMLSSYVNNIDFKNSFLTKYFYYIDDKRKLMGKTYLLPLSKAEKKKHGLMSPFSLPTRAEIQACWFPLLKWFVIFLVTVVVLVVDHMYYTVISSIVKSTNDTQSTMGAQTLNINVKGEGFVAEMLRDLLSFNSTASMDSTTRNDHCISQNKVNKLDADYVFMWILGPLLGMLLFQVLFGFIIKRLTLFYVVDFIFRRRSKARTIQLYNKILYARSNMRKAARARIRRAVQKHTLRGTKNTIWTYFPRLKSIVDSLFKTGKCLMCLEAAKKKNLEHCDKEGCTATFCERCWEENEERCYACMVEEGVVDDVRTQFVVLEEQQADSAPPSSSNQ